MIGFELTRKVNELEEIARQINNLPLRESLRLSCAGYINMQIQNKEGEEIDGWTGDGRLFLSKFEDTEYKLELKNEMFGDQNLSIRKRFKIQGEWHTKEEGYNKGIGAPLANQEEIFIYSI